MREKMVNTETNENKNCEKRIIFENLVILKLYNNKSHKIQHPKSSTCEYKKV